MIKLLLDANQSPETRKYLIKTFHFDVVDIVTEGKTHLDDEEIVSWAKKESRVIVTFDLDFGEIYHLREKGKLGVIILRLEDQTVESVVRRLHKFFKEETENIDLNTSLVVIEESRIRIDK